MKTHNFEFIPFSENDLLSITSIREGEQKLGQVLQYGLTTNAKFVIFGIQEDIGPQANSGFPGAQNAFDSALKKFVNMQSNRMCKGENIAIGGKVVQHCHFENIEQARVLVSELDELLVELFIQVFKNNQIPIVIGGGHNNAYPLIKAFSLVNETELEVVNFDPHADCRQLEGRHSGNPFSYAKEHGFLSNYTVLGLHAAYNSESMLKYMNEKQFYYSYFEEYIIRPDKIESDLQTIIIRSDDPIGIELDMDAIKFMPSSAFTSSGISIEQARRYIMKMASSKRKPAYLHLPEAAPLTELDTKIASKGIAYLIHDFVATCK